MLQKLFLVILSLSILTNCVKNIDTDAPASLSKAILTNQATFIMMPEYTGEVDNYLKTTQGKTGMYPTSPFLIGKTVATNKKTILTFNTSHIPDNARITGVMLSLALRLDINTDSA